MGSFEIGLLLVVAYICVYGITNRICSCIEECFECKYCRKDNNYDKGRNEKKSKVEEEI